MECRGAGAPAAGTPGVSPEALLTAIELIALTKLDGRTAYVNPAHIVQLAEPRQEDANWKELPPEVRCVVGLAGGGYVSVRETCAEVRKLFVEKEPKP